MSKLVQIMEALLMEGKLERETTYISRKLIQRLKRVGKRGDGFTNGMTFNLGATVMRPIRNVNRVNVRLELSDDEFPVASGEYAFLTNKRSRSSINITIYGSTAWSDYDTALRDFSDLILSLKEIIRHELEHSNQTSDYLMGIKSRERGFDPTLGPIVIKEPDIPTDRDSIAKIRRYYTHPSEIPAFVAGLYKRAKTDRAPFNWVMDQRLELIATLGREVATSEGQVGRMVDDIRAVWTQYARKRFPKATFIDR